MERGRLPHGGIVLLALMSAALIVQSIHMSEHIAQMAMWIRYPGRPPWMSDWAAGISRWLGGVRLDRNAESSLAMARGMEYLHLIGNLVFLIGVILLWHHTKPNTQGRARRWAGATVAVQGLHVIEHIALTITILTTGQAVGFSTTFGALDGTRLSTYRVWWHGSINLAATALCVVALASLRTRSRAGASWVRPGTILPGTLAACFTVPLVMAVVAGTSNAAATASRSAHDDAPADVSRSALLVDVASDVGLSVTHSAFRWDVTMDPVAMMGGGLCWLDVDRDGWLDLFITDTWSDGEWGLWNAAGGLPTTRIFANLDGRFEERTEEWGAGYEARANGCVAADFDRDGWTDLYVTTARSNLLLWNQAGTGFVEGASLAGADAYGWHTGVAAGDIDGNGFVDLVVAGYADLNRARPNASTGFPNTFEPVAGLVLMNRGPSELGRAIFEAVDAGFEASGPEYGLGISLIDIDGDGDLDLLVANDTQPNRLYLNESPDGRQDRLFRDISAASGANDRGSGMGIAARDVTADKRPDIVVTNLKGQGHAALASKGPRAFRQRGLPTVSDVGLESTGWGVSFGDIDLDGDLDLLLASGDIPIQDLAAAGEALTYLENIGSSSEPRFTDATTHAGLDAVRSMNGRAVALADYDNDGDLDAAISAIGQPLVLLSNLGDGGNWLLVDAGTPVPGMRVRAELANGLVLERSAVVGSSWLSSEDPRIHLGLGDADVIDRLSILMPGCGEHVINNVAAGQILHLDACGAEPPRNNG